MEQRIDTEKLLEWLQAEEIRAINEDISWAYRQVARAINDGSFNVKEVTHE